MFWHLRLQGDMVAFTAVSELGSFAFDDLVFDWLSVGLADVNDVLLVFHVQD